MKKAVRRGAVALSHKLVKPLDLAMGSVKSSGNHKLKNEQKPNFFQAWKKNMKKQRIMNIVRKCVLSLAALALVGWLGYSAYVSHESKQEREVAEVNYDAVNNYLSGLGE